MMWVDGRMFCLSGTAITLDVMDLYTHILNSTPALSPPITKHITVSSTPGYDLITIMTPHLDNIHDETTFSPASIASKGRRQRDTR